MPSMDKGNTEDMQSVKPKSSKVVWLIVLIVVIVVIALWKTGNLAIGNSSGDYQAVFLTNNQVYFGKVSSLDSQYPVLRDIFYLQVTQALQPKDEKTPPATSVNLVKLGAEIHGPTDKMLINRNQILFIEDLSPDSQVVLKIKEYKAGQVKK